MVFRLTAAQIITAKTKQEEIGRLSGHGQISDLLQVVCSWDTVNCLCT